MLFLPIVQALHREAKLPGAPPATVVGQIGRAADLVAWAAESYNDIQRENDGKWRWLLSQFTFAASGGGNSYPTIVISDTIHGGFISVRFRAFEIDERNKPFIYQASEGIATERELPHCEYALFRSRYLRAAHTYAPPSCYTVDPLNNFLLGPTPDTDYALRGPYWRSNQTLAADDDEPEMPADYHMLIVWNALINYGYNEVANEVLSKAIARGAPIHDALMLNQAYSRFSWGMPNALA